MPDAPLPHAPAAPPGAPGDLSACDREPIHVPGCTQAHGVVLALRRPDHAVMMASANAPARLGLPMDKLLGRTPADLFGPEQAAALERGLDNPSLDRSPLYLRTMTVEAGGGPRPFHAIGHRRDGAVVLELEPAASANAVNFHDLYPLVRAFIDGVQTAEGVTEICQLSADEVRRITGFDRVMVYQFDDRWNGHVVAESRADHLKPFLGLWFPASDIPRQARDLYSLSRLRLIADAQEPPAGLVPPLRPDTGRPLDLSLAVLRGVSPVHAEYLGNMGVRGSMSVAVQQDGRLWGLVACHHATPLPVPIEVRTACDLASQYLAQQLAARERAAEFARRVYFKSVRAELLADMASAPEFAEGLTRDPQRLLSLTGASGAAVVSGGACRLVGECPSEGECRRVAEWLAAGRGELYSTEALPAELPEAAGFRSRPGGLLAIQTSKLHRAYVLWFRPEIVTTVSWGGDPRKPAEPEPGTGRLHPRKSFEAWKETVRGRSAAWRPAELQAAADLRNDVVGVVLRRAEEVAQLVEDVRRSNEELESFSYSVSHDLRAPFRHIVGYAELLRERAAGLDATSRRFLETILESARYAGTLVDNLLAFSRLSRSRLDQTPIDLNLLVEEVRKDVMALEAGGRAIAWEVGPLPAVRGDLEMLRLVVRNLLSNAVKYTGRVAEPRVTVSGGAEGREAVVRVSDNGAGFDMRYADKLFGVFQRLHRPEEFEGTGIGLATVRRVVARHGGRAWGEGTPGGGATFSFALPLEPQGD